MWKPSGIVEPRIEAYWCGLDPPLLDGLRGAGVGPLGRADLMTPCSPPLPILTVHPSGKGTLPHPFPVHR